MMKHISIPGNKDLILGISGGVDSSVLLDYVLRSKFKSRVRCIAHFNHKLRPTADLDEEFVRLLASKHSIEFRSEKWESPIDSEGKARDARYDFLLRVAREYNSDLVTAHHRDDLTETIIDKMSRGSGVKGLTSLRESRDEKGIKIFRPFLNVSKKDVLDYAKDHNLDWVTDESNADLKYKRNSIRSIVTPSFARAGLEGFDESLYRTYNSLKRADEALDWMTSKLSKECIVCESQSSVTFDKSVLKSYPDEIVLRILMDSYNRIVGDPDLGFRAQEGFLSNLKNGKSFYMNIRKVKIEFNKVHVKLELVDY